MENKLIPIPIEIDVPQTIQLGGLVFKATDIKFYWGGLTEKFNPSPQEQQGK